ncbi:bifunctional diaminohydroxyphosphoribosylaminopyrimidine deaminase/5-amino-6-(5-phosphoribosylamino)uracil reductase RibD [Spirosoma montaniterrae]|uniref:Riboflavin biosynthesis protein RibD n=1 Tax=Spirosoma montaniterrae TaxID=1178516 RepID=A0A1P9WWK8_9BACT|nr:bifunctional diaminohydroxyphosphoribosylaminopyrimidine deaminase/5-amino-6-(5-phosphoribosylamino)uracil reductase RibD [Spirosoma montaniterrae]AQG79720.1 bifunctional diaminohydroxyphosphoribosylaminopyrimidine deaminase/5-amino-6-(5-phosphoribosylamino)uracil reductase [Spirosoma montaniterrae]
MNELYMRRALELAALGRGHVSPNPMVGCVIVHDATERIIGEGWHQRYGEAHAERNAIASVRPDDLPLLPESTAYVTLEPCSHFGKQPPCADLLVEKRIGRVICCNDDPFPLVAGTGFAKLRAANIPVGVGLLADEGRQLNARFFTAVEKKRPYLILKWAETADGFIGAEGGRPAQISGALAQRLVHRWRAEEDAIMVGTNTARADNPRLNVRLWAGGRNPTRIVFDRNLLLPPNLHLFDGSQPTLVLYNETYPAPADAPNLNYIPIQSTSVAAFNQSIGQLHARRIQSILVEGGTTLLNAFIDSGLWDEMRVFRAPKLLGAGVKAPTVRGQIISRERIGDDELSIYKPLRQTL